MLPLIIPNQPHTVKLNLLVRAALPKFDAAKMKEIQRKGKPVSFVICELVYYSLYNQPIPGDIIDFILLVQSPEAQLAMDLCSPQIWKPKQVSPDYEEISARCLDGGFENNLNAVLAGVPVDDICV